MKRETMWAALGLVMVVGVSGGFGCHVRANGMNGNFHISINGSRDHEVKEKFEKVFKAEKVKTLQVTASAGDIVIEPDEKADEINIKAVKVVSGDKKEKDLKPYLAQLEVTAVLKDDRLVVESKFPEIKNVSGYVNYKITVPKRLALDLNSASGNVTAQGVTGGVQIETASGEIAIKNVGGASGGQIKLHSASGNIKVTDAQADSLFSLEAASGELEAKNIRAVGSVLKVHLVSQSGSVHFSGDAGEFDASAASGEIEADLTSKLTLLSANLHSASGNVQLTLPASVSAKVDASTASGSLNPPQGVPNPEEDTRKLAFSLGSGTAPVHIDTASGDIIIQTR